MSFRLVPKSVTLNDLERRNVRYFALFQRIRVAFGAHCVKVLTFAISSHGEFLYQYLRLQKTRVPVLPGGISVQSFITVPPRVSLTARQKSSTSIVLCTAGLR